MLTPDEVVDVTRDMWKRHLKELPDLERIRGYKRGEYGVPPIPEGAGDELRDIARNAVQNVLSLVCNAFTSALSVEGFRSPDETENGPAWQKWQAQKLDARQAQVHSSAVTYGSAYAFYLDGQVLLRSPRRAFALYVDPETDDWPRYALETWIDDSGPKPVRRGRLVDDEHVYPVDLGTVTTPRPKSGSSRSTQPRITVTYVEAEASKHGFDHAPVVRFVNPLDDEDGIGGEVAPLIGDQKALNAVNFDRLCVSRFGAFRQKYAIGWAPSQQDVVKASVARLMAIADGEVKVGDFNSTDLSPYNELLQDMRVQVALKSQAPIMAVLGSLTNVGAETVTNADAQYQNKLRIKRESFGESWEQLIRLMADEGVDDAAEVVWRKTETIPFGAAVDGISKLAAAEPALLEVLVDDVPGWGQQRAEQARSAIRRGAGRGVLNDLRQAAAAAGGATNADMG